MSKNITIQEGGVAKQLAVDKLKTNLVGSGTCLWVPEDEVQLTIKTITENGTYKASDDGVYGFGEVIVNVPGGAGGPPGGPGSSVVGTDGDGDESIVSVDGDGNLNTEKVPSSIEVITPPTNPYGIYMNGATIGTEGMVVKAYLESGGEYGTVPNAEITLDPTIATYDPSTDDPEGTAEYGGKTCTYCSPGDMYVSYGKTEQDKINNTYGYASISGSGSIYGVMIAEGAGRYMYVFSDQPFNGTYRGYMGEVNTCVGGPFTVDGVVYYTAGIAGTFSDSYINVEYFPSESYVSYTEAIRCLFKGTLTPVTHGSHQTITVSWPRPGGGQVLETTFEILVAPPIYGGGES